MKILKGLMVIMVGLCLTTNFTSWTWAVINPDPPLSTKDAFFYEIEIAIQKAQLNEVPAFAPTFFAKALELYKCAESDYKKGGRIDKIQKTIKEAIEVLNEGSAVARVSKAALAEVYDMRQGVSHQEYIIKPSSKKFAEAEKKYQEAILKAEEWDIRGARQKAEEAMQSYREMVLIAIEKGPIKDAEERLKQSKKTIPPEQYESSINELKSLKNYVKNAKAQKFDIPIFINDVHNKISGIMDPTTIGIRDPSTIGLRDPVASADLTQAIEEALSKARQYKAEALLVISQIECGVDRALLQIAALPPPPPRDPNLGSGGRHRWPRYRREWKPIVRPVRQPLVDTAFCEEYYRNAQIAVENAKESLDYLDRILSQVNEIKNHISSRRYLADSEKASFQNTLSSLKTDAQNTEADFDRFIRDIEGFLEAYRKCRDNRGMNREEMQE